jgi:CPA1 family monovalent cation:H+ antiporter
MTFDPLAQLRDMPAHSLEFDIEVVVAMLGVALLAGIIAQRTGLPYIVLLVAASLSLQLPNIIGEQFTPLLLLVFLPALIFEAAWNIDAAALRRYWLQITVLALPGVVLTALLVAGGLSLLGLLPLLPALLLGAILAATDPIAVIAIFRRLSVPSDLQTIVEGESLFNDGVAVVLTGLFTAAVATGAQGFDLPAAGLSLVKVTAGGAALGLVAAGLLLLLLRTVPDAMLLIVGTVVATYGAYLAADKIHFSGIFAVLAVGVALRAFKGFPAKAAAEEVDRFWSALAFIANSLVFLAMGLGVEFERILKHPQFVLATLGLLIVARLILAYGALPLTGLRAGKESWLHVIALSGIRGALSVALALGLPHGLPYRADIIDAVYGVVVVTLVGQGLALPLVLRRLRFPAVAAGV